MVYIDSNVFVYAVTHDPAMNLKARRAIRVLKEVEEDREEGETSLLTWDEVTWVVWKLKGYEVGMRAGAAFLKLQNLTLLPVSSSVMVKAQQLVDMYQLKPRDAIHVGSALLAGEREVVSDDSELDVVREIARVPLD